MSITKINDLEFELEYASGYDNDIIDLEFKKEGLEIGCHDLDWEDIKTAYKKLFGENIDD